MKTQRSTPIEELLTEDHAIKLSKEYDQTKHSISYDRVFVDGYMKAIEETDIGKLADRIKELTVALDNLVSKCLSSDGYNQKYDELFKAQQALSKVTTK